MVHVMLEKGNIRLRTTGCMRSLVARILSVNDERNVLSSTEVVFLLCVCVCVCVFETVCLACVFHLKKKDFSNSPQHQKKNDFL